eukprot:Gb_08804 [translate_table: standard]
MAAKSSKASLYLGAPHLPDVDAHEKQGEQEGWMAHAKPPCSEKRMNSTSLRTNVIYRNMHASPRKENQMGDLLILWPPSANIVRYYSDRCRSTGDTSDCQGA